MTVPCTPSIFHTKGGLTFHGTVFLSEYAAILAQGKYSFSCILLALWACMRHDDIFFSRRYFFFFDAQNPYHFCVDRQSALCAYITFSVFRFCGLYLRAQAAVAGELWKSFSVFPCFPWRSAGLWLRRMAYPVASYVQRLRVCSGALLVLATLYFRMSSVWFSWTWRICVLRIADRKRWLLCSLAFFGASDRNLERVSGYADSCWIWFMLMKITLPR